jgi:hypothetical protein
LSGLVRTPEQVASGVSLLSGYFDVFITSRPAAGIGGWVRVLAPTLPDIGGVPTPGFSSFAYNSSTCALAALDLVFCSNDLFRKAYFLTVPEIDYVPVQPVRSLPLTSKILK